MNIQQLRAAKQAMEDALLLATATELTKFRARTGMSPSHISIDLANVTQVGDSEMRACVARVNVGVKI